MARWQELSDWNPELKQTVDDGKEEAQKCAESEQAEAEEYKHPLDDALVSLSSLAFCLQHEMRKARDKAQARFLSDIAIQVAQAHSLIQDYLVKCDCDQKQKS